MTAPIKIAFHIMGGEYWTVGSIYLRNLIYALRAYNNVKLYLLAPVNQRIEDYESDFGVGNVLFYSVPQTLTPLWAINGLSKRVLSRDFSMEGFLKEHQIDAVFNSTIIHKYPRVATLSWLPDFQHTHFPEMFSKTECLSRDKKFLQSARISTRIILMSKAVKRDFESFAPIYAQKVRVLQPMSHVPQSIYEDNLHFILNLYHLPEKFFYLPNQFWKHKNHELVFQAIKFLKDRGLNVMVVCTGNSVDSRHPTYFANLCGKLSEWNIRDQVIYLGLIPHEHVFLLMRQSICVLNPSLFEGWGYTVEEARSVGKQVLLSDIPAHREQNPPKATFFNPRDFNDLMEKLRQIWLSTDPGPDVKLESEARCVLRDRLRAYAETFVSVADEAIQEI